ncbi:hypothetical protein KBD81_00725 [Candidatus Woesebacteria bacterium]|nr:hypothetical protein [Candidatus Woesebacteria bacterium]
MIQALSPRHNFSHSFIVSPTVRFMTQHENEQVILVVRQHPLTQLGWIANAFLFSIFAFLANFFIPQFLDENHIIVFNLFAIFFIFSYIWVNILLWYFTVGLISTERVVDLDFFNILYKEFTATTILQVSDITTSIGGFFGSLFNFGDVLVKTEGFQQNIEFLDIPHPSEVVQILNQLMPKTGPQN